jgi:hypothetical protein
MKTLLTSILILLFHTTQALTTTCVEVTYFNGDKDTLVVVTDWEQSYELTNGGIFQEAGALIVSWRNDATKRKTVAVTVRSYRIIKCKR